jgi:hypothetical protein
MLLIKIIDFKWAVSERNLFEICAKKKVEFIYDHYFFTNVSVVFGHLLFWGLKVSFSH